MAELILMYHNIAGNTARIDFNEWSPVYDVAATDFENQMTQIAESDHQVELTFDDGYASMVESVLPMVQNDPSLRCHCFVTTDAIGRAGMLTAPELRQLAEHGVQIGTHSHTHTFLQNLSAHGLQDEILQPKNILEQVIGSAVTSMSLPGGRYDQRTLQFAAKVGYHQVYTSRPGFKKQSLPGHAKLDLLPRWSIDAGTSAKDFSRLLRFDLAAVAQRKWRYHLGQSARFILGQNGYHRLWRQVRNNEREAS